MAFLEDDLQVQTREHDGVTIIDLKGDVTTFADAKLNEAYRAATASGSQPLILNFARSNYINSAGIAILIRIVTDVNRTGQKLAMVGLNDHFQKIFRMVGLAQYADLYEDEDQAIAALTKNDRA
ncbi:MAG: STAS domain-containing protein [Herpetosiphonaceae bacterium]|nr:STAS domain-containing protein [Herpetosiphonaceae bacterium]